MDSTTNKREHPRLKHSAKIQVTLANGDKTIAMLRDLSETGLYLRYQETASFTLGERLTVQTLEFEGAPVQMTEIVRIEPGQGIALKFVR